MAEIVDVTGAGREAAIGRAVGLLRSGSLVSIPTDTVYGAAADAFDLTGTALLFAAKRRTRAVPLPVLVRSPKQLPGLVAAVSPAAEALTAAFWPGPVTLVLPVAAHLRWDLGESAGTVAVRMPRDEVALELVRRVGPLAVTGANAPGGPLPRTADEADLQLGAELALILDDGPRDGWHSTVVDLTGAQPVVLRPGAVEAERVLAVAAGRKDPFDAGRASPRTASARGEDLDGEAPDDR